MTCMLVMRSGREDLVAVGPAPVGYRAAVIGDGLGGSAGWAAVRIAGVLAGEQVGTIAALSGG